MTTVAPERHVCTSRCPRTGPFTDQLVLDSDGVRLHAQRWSRGDWPPPAGLYYAVGRGTGVQHLMAAAVLAAVSDFFDDVEQHFDLRRVELVAWTRLDEGVPHRQRTAEYRFVEEAQL